MTPVVLATILAAIFATVLAQVLLKLGMSAAPIQSAISNTPVIPEAVLKSMLFEPLLYVGLGFYAMATVLWLFVLAKVDLSLAYPFVAIGVLATVMIGSLVLSEPVGPLRWAGAALITVGIALVAHS